MKKIILILLTVSLGLPIFAKPNYSYTVNSTPRPNQNYVQQTSHNNWSESLNNKVTPSSANNNYGSYVDEEITTPLTQIGIPEQYLQPQVEEEGLEIEWNQWHANVRNYVMKKRLFSAFSLYNYSNSIYHIMYTVHKNGDISDVVVAQFIGGNEYSYKVTINNLSEPRLISDYAIALKDKKDGKYKNYIYKLETNNIDFYKDSIADILKKSSFKKDATFWDGVHAAANVAQNIEKCAGNSVLTFPAKSKRDKVVVDQIAICGLDIAGSKDSYDPSAFNDIEKVK